jgi:hypothetical protein
LWDLGREPVEILIVIVEPTVATFWEPFGEKNNIFVYEGLEDF